MLNLKEAIKKIEQYIPVGYTICNNYGEAQGKYIFVSKDSHGIIPPGAFHWTVNKETGECKCEYLEREGDKPFSPIRGYKKLYLEDEP